MYIHLYETMPGSIYKENYNIFLPFRNDISYIMSKYKADICAKAIIQTLEFNKLHFYVTEWELTYRPDLAKVIFILADLKDF